MAERADGSSDAASAGIVERIEAVEAFVDISERLVTVGELKWADVEADYRLLAANSALRRQFESIRGAVLLCRQNLGHLAVSFVRASLEDVMYLTFFASLEVGDSQRLFLAMGSWDSLRSLLAQRQHLGDEVMAELWYPREFLDSAQVRRDHVRDELKALRPTFGWPGGLLPSGDWLADQAGQRPLYDYLYAATSRAIHFSAGEILRRGWGEPGGKVVTDKPEFREHLAAFALDQLCRLLGATTDAVMPLLDAAGISSDEELRFEQIEPVLDRLNALGRVPLVHAREWNLTPTGPPSVKGLHRGSR